MKAQLIIPKRELLESNESEADDELGKLTTQPSANAASGLVGVVSKREDRRSAHVADAAHSMSTVEILSEKQTAH